MFDKYFGFLKTHDEDSILQTLLEHSKIDSEELLILSRMFKTLIGKEDGDLNMMFNQIQSINTENVKVFETVTDHIIQSNFDFQKQYDLLRLQQRIDAISGLIIATAKRVLITHNINAKVPTELHELFEQLLTLVIDSQATFIEAIM